MIPENSSCPCGSGRTLNACCGPFLTGAACAPSAEMLMRSRYSAFARGQSDYLLATWHPSTRPDSLDLDPELRWIGLKILSTEAGAPGEREGRVCFVARSKLDGRANRLKECSRFVYELGRWFYVGAELS